MLSLNFSAHPEVVCRPALPKDTGQVLELCSHIWDGGDYIPRVWAEWLADPEGLLGVAELAGRVVGVFKLTKFQEKEWYLEGLRVHPDVQGMGIASHIQSFVLETWKRMGNGVVRLVTASYNVKVHRMCEEHGFKRIAEFIPYRAVALQGVQAAFTHTEIEEVEQVLDFLQLSQTHACSAGLINLGWVFGDPQIKHIEEVIGYQHAWWWHGRAGFISILEDDEGEEREPGIQLLACSISQLDELLLDYRKLMGDIGYKSAGWTAPNDPQVIGSLEKTGFERTWDKSIYAYELKSVESLK